MIDQSQILARLDPSPIRRWIAILIVAGVGLTLIYLAASNPMGNFGTSLSVLGLGCGLLWVANFIRNGSSQAIVLTIDGLFLEQGQTLAEMSNIQSVDRSVMAFKPSNGFMVRLKTPGTRGWAPGIWWRVGRSLGIGGATSRDHARNMADTLNTILAQDAPDLDQGKLR